MNEVLKALLLRKLAGRGGGGGYPEPTGTKQITANGTGIDVKDFASADVNVPNTYSAADENKVVQSGALVAQTQKSVNANGTYDTTANNSVVVDVPTSAGLKEYASTQATKYQFRTWTNTFKAGNTLTVALAPTDGTTVEVGDEVLVHGKIASTAGTSFNYYVTGVVTSFDSSNKPVITVKGLGQPSPIADGAYSVNSNGSYNISEYSSLNVNVQGEGTTYITENGTHDVGGYKYASVNVESGGGDVKILFATDAVYADQPVQGNSCNAEVLDIDLSSYSEGDKVVLYGQEPNMTGGNFLVVGTITSFSFPSVVYFDVDEVSEIAGGGGKGLEIAIIMNTTLDSEPQKGSEVRVTPSSSSDIDNLGTDDLVFVQGDAFGTNYVFVGSVVINGGSEISVSVRNVTFVYESNVVKFSGATFRDTPNSGNICTVALSDPSEAYNVSNGDGVMVTGIDEQTGSTYAVYGVVNNVDTSSGVVLLDVRLADDFS